MPSAPAYRAAARSSGNSMLASSRIRTPSAVTAGPRRSCAGPGGRRAVVPLPGCACQHVLARVDDHFARRTVDHHELTGLNHAARVVESHDRRNLERAREDGRVVRAAAGVSGKAAHARPVDLRDERRGQLVRNQHRGLVELAEQVAGSRHARPKVHFQPAYEVSDVALALAKIRIGDLVEDRR